LLRLDDEDRGPGTVRLAAADEDRCAAIAVAGGSAALLAAPLLAGAVDVAALAGRARRGAAVGELPRHDPVKDVGARLDAEDLVVELDVAALAGVEVLDLDLHLSLPCFVGGRLSPSDASASPSAESEALASSPASSACFRPRRFAMRRLPARRRSPDFLVARKRRHLVNRALVDQAGGHAPGPPARPFRFEQPAG
jgi:hypothetical protein